MKFDTYFIPAFVFFGALAGCAASPSHPTSSHSSAIGSSPTIPSELDGTWKKDCNNSEFFGTTGTYTFSSGRLEVVETLYVESDCKTPIDTERNIYNVIRVVNKNEGIFNTDLAFQHVYKMAASERGKAFLEGRNNKQGLCGISNWDVGTERELTEADCSDANTAAFMPSPGTVIFHSFKLTPQGLLIGKIKGLATTEAGRPVSFSDRPMRKSTP